MGNSTSAPSAVESCLSDLCAGREGCAASPQTPFYQQEWVRTFNLEVPVEPAAVVRPLDAEEVAAAVKCAVAGGLKVQAVSGGHSYA